MIMDAIRHLKRQIAMAKVRKAEDRQLRQTVQDSGLFDAAWYLARYPDVAAQGSDPLHHFLAHGLAEGRDPGPGFDTTWYLAEHYDDPTARQNPLLHFIDHEGEVFVSPRPLHQGQAFEAFNRAVRAGLLDGRRMLDRIDHVSFGMKLPRAPGQISTLPLPPVELSLRVGSPTLDSFEEIGREAQSIITRCLPPGFIFERSRCLDFGCGIGRVIRHFETQAATCEFWGCDIDGTSIQWCNENLSPPFRFFQLSDTPVIPLESASFDFVYALSVFSQVFQDWQCLAMEIRRILKPGGVFFMSFNGQTSFEDIVGKPYGATLANVGMYVDGPFRAWNKGGPNVALSPDFIETHWGALFDIDFIAMEGLGDYQSLSVMRKPEAGSPRAKVGSSVLHLSTSQDFDPNATGKLRASFDASMPFRESFGIVGSGSIEVGGWFVFRNDRLSAVEAMVGDARVTIATAAFQAEEGIYKDWGAPRMFFSIRLDATTISPGLYRLAVTGRSESGREHRLSMPLTIR